MTWQWLLACCCACGRLGFEPAVHRDDGSPGSADAPTGDAPPAGAVHFAGLIVAQSKSGLGADTFTATPRAAGDAILVHVFCENTAEPTAVTLTAPGWTWTELQPIAGTTSQGFWATVFGAIAPSTTPATVTATWAATGGCTFIDEMGDEFTGNDPTGGITTFDSSGAVGAMGNCNASVTTQVPNEAVWSACTTNCVTGPGAGFTKSADDGNCDASEYKETTDPALTPEPTAFVTQAGTAYVATSVTIRPL